MKRLILLLRALNTFSTVMVVPQVLKQFSRKVMDSESLLSFLKSSTKGGVPYSADCTRAIQQFWLLLLRPTGLLLMVYIAERLKIISNSWKLDIFIKFCFINILVASCVSFHRSLSDINSYQWVSQQWSLRFIDFQVHP